MTNETPNLIQDESIEVLESLVVKYGDLCISVSGDPSGVLAGKTSDQTILFCADVLRRSVGETSLEEAIEIPRALKDTLVLNYGWSDIDFNKFIQLWRRNIYLLKVGADNGVDVDLEEYSRFTTYLEKKKAKDLDELEVGSQETEEDSFVAAVEEAEKVSSEVAKNSETLLRNNDSIIDGSIAGASDLQALSDATTEEVFDDKNEPMPVELTEQIETPKIMVDGIEIETSNQKDVTKKLKRSKK